MIGILGIFINALTMVKFMYQADFHRVAKSGTDCVKFYIDAGHHTFDIQGSQVKSIRHM